jgi:hypothetical protein
MISSQFFITFLLSVYQTYGRDALLRMLTVPEREVRRVCRRTGADPEEAIAARNRWAEDTVVFIEELALAD